MGRAEQAPARVAVVARDERRDLRQSQLLVRELHTREEQRNHENRLGNPLQALPGCEHRDEFTIFNELRTGEAHRANEDDADEVVVELEQLGPPEISDQEDRDQARPQRGRLDIRASALDARHLVGDRDEAVEVERHVDRDDKARENHEQYERVDQKLPGDISIDDAHPSLARALATEPSGPRSGPNAR